MIYNCLYWVGWTVYIAHINDRNEEQTCNEHSRNTAQIAANLLKDIDPCNAR